MNSPVRLRIVINCARHLAILVFDYHKSCNELNKSMEVTEMRVGENKIKTQRIYELRLAPSDTKICVCVCTHSILKATIKSIQSHN